MNPFNKNTAHVRAGAPEFLIVGLGNPGSQYERTRHNAGFIAIDALAEDCGAKIDRLKYKSLYCDTTVNGHRCLLQKPQTYMNLSGEAVREIAAFYKIPVQNIIVLSDDVSLNPGKLRIRRKGSDGGQKGLRSIISHMSSQDFPRVKLGVGAKPHPDYDMGDWVLSNFNKNEMKELEAAVKNAVEAVKLMVDGKTDRAMNLYNS